MPRLCIIAGCNGAGKTTASYTVIPEMYKQLDEYVNADEIAETLSPQDPSKVAIRASRIMMERIRELLGKRESFAVETTLAVRSFARIILDARQTGYFVTLLFFWLSSPELAKKRVAMRVAAGGHSVEDATIARRYEQGIDNLKRIYMPICDEWVLYDNSDFEAKTIAKGGELLPLRIFNEKKYKTILTQTFDD